MTMITLTNGRLKGGELTLSPELCWRVRANICRARLAPQAVRLEFFDRLFYFGVFKHTWRPDLKGDCILFAERLQLNGKPHRLAEIRAGRDHPVIGEKRAGAAAQCFQHRLG